MAAEAIGVGAEERVRERVGCSGKCARSSDKGGSDRVASYIYCKTDNETLGEKENTSHLSRASSLPGAVSFPPPFGAGTVDTAIACNCDTLLNSEPPHVPVPEMKMS